MKPSASWTTRGPSRPSRAASKFFASPGWTQVLLLAMGLTSFSGRGGPGAATAALQWWRGAVRAAAERAGPTASIHGMLWRTVGFLSVALQRSNFQVVAGCAPSLSAEAEGRLGRPLSEVPEFWRAAPEAAVEWAAEDLDIPPPRRGDLDTVEAEGLVGAGHLRAAGLRL